ncbi:tetratricopeptide repeat family protein [Orientia chuto str. Dubai]|uniref:Tetratricopeptide repeat family protein n=1 Tax=Orientia chuto str. Dubai TaxID=1359168 RepID=A0A0F3ML17_9RICK|nr:tetratricopeptide repeat protein [Candidatus Orientia mediorientalis]KJV56440.1 tetratricopeptide repeat family protein [Orientia chuto str. Dubai]
MLAEKYFSKGITLHKLGQYHEAIENFEQLLNTTQMTPLLIKTKELLCMK